MSIERGQTLALVGSSGCGKSTVVQLLQRFYDIDDGSICINGKDVRRYKVHQLRSMIGIVSQEPVLFAMSIEDNIRLGHDAAISFEEVQNAAKEANAHNFIMQLPQQYKTMVGERGAQLSGGQKQRVAIARALVRNPPILLLDEATSALDNESESIVQAALDEVSQGRTTIIIAHRLSTIRNADVIASVKDGKIEEFGTHDELMAKQGLYYDLVTSQSDGKTDLNKEEEPAMEKKFQRTLSRKSTRKGRGLSTSGDDGDDDDAKDAEMDEEVAASSGDVFRLWRLNMPELPFLLLGFLGAAVVGGTQPAFAIIFAEILNVFSTVDLVKQEIQANFWSLMFLILGIVAGLGFFTMSLFLAISAERLTTRLRTMTFRAILSQEIGFFDLPKNRTGALCARLATDATQASGATGGSMGAIIQAIANMGTAIIIAFVYSWQMTLLIFAFVPFIMLGGLMEMKVHTGEAQSDKESQEESSHVALEAVNNMRTVASLQKEEMFYQRYTVELRKIHKKSTISSVVFGISFGFSQGVIFFAYAAAFALGAYLIEKGDLEFLDLMKVFAALMFGAMALGQASSFAPDAAKAKTSSGHIFRLVDRPSLIDPYANTGVALPQIDGRIHIRGARFFYPTRPEVQVLQGLNIDIPNGNTVALVGSSGCGKSTVVQLLQRFYDPIVGDGVSEVNGLTAPVPAPSTNPGAILIDGVDSKTMNVDWMRSQMGLVSQEPILFEGSILENILYGVNHRTEVPMDEVMEAAKKANIHEFVAGLPLGYDTNVGAKGTQLSGGQKQRVAIARALIRNPKILLLDEATSALDTESEKQVQDALDAAQVGRTTVVIAHRLSTIQNADSIVVIKDGRVIESGKHDELMQLGGHYFNLHNSNVVL